MTKDKELENIFYVVEANSFERSTLWEEWSQASLEPRPNRTLLNWAGQAHGFSVQVGKLDRRPVMVSITFDTINGAKIVFYDAISQVVDHRMVDKWVEENLISTLPNGRQNHCDAMNFVHCVHAIQDYACESINV